MIKFTCSGPILYMMPFRKCNFGNVQPKSDYGEDKVDCNKGEDKSRLPHVREYCVLLSIICNRKSNMVEQNLQNSCNSLGHCQTSVPEILERKLAIISHFADGDAASIPCIEGELINLILLATELSLPPQGHPQPTISACIAWATYCRLG